MAPLFGFLKRNKNKTTDGYASEPQSYTGTWVERQRKAYKNRSRAQDVLKPEMTNPGPWEVRDGTMRPVHGYPVSQGQPTKPHGYDGPSPEDYAAWNDRAPSVALDRYGSVQSKATTFYPPISLDEPSFPDAEIRNHQRTRSRSIESRPDYPTKDTKRRSERHDQVPPVQLQPSVQGSQIARPASRNSYLPPQSVPATQTPYLTPFLPPQQTGAQPFAQVVPPPRVPSDSHSEKMRRRTVSGPTQTSQGPPPNGEDPLKRMKNDLQVTSFLLNKLRGFHSDSSAQRYANKTNQAVAPPSAQRPSHRRAASAMGVSGTPQAPVCNYRPEVNPMKLVDPYIDRRKHGTEFHQMMNHGLLTNPTASWQTQESSSRSRSRTRSDAAVHPAISTTAYATQPSSSSKPHTSNGASTSKRSRHTSDAYPPSSQHPPIHVRQTASAPTASSSKRPEGHAAPLFGNFRNPSQFPDTAYLSVPSREFGRDSRDRDHDRERSRRRDERDRERSRDRDRSRERDRSRDRERSRERERERDRDRERDRERGRDQRERERARDREREREKEQDRQQRTLRKKRRESAPAAPLAPQPEKIVPIDSDDSGYHSSTTRHRGRRPSSSSGTPMKPNVPAGLPLDDTPGIGITPEAVAQGLAMTKSEKSDRRVRFRGGADSVITTPATQAIFKGLPARPALGKAH